MITLKAEKRNPNVKAKKLRREGYVTGILVLMHILYAKAYSLYLHLYDDKITLL